MAAATQVEIPNIDITVTPENLKDDLFKIYNQLFKDISKDEIEFEELQGGYVNSIFLLKLKKDKSKSLIFRTFNFKFSSEQFAEEFKKTSEQLKTAENQNGEIKQNDDTKPDEKPKDFSDMIFNRITEYQVMQEVAKHNLCQKVYGRYNNGIIYGFTPGIVLNGPLMLTMDFLQEASEKLAKFHSIKYDIPSIPFKTHHDRVYVQLGPHFQLMMENIDKEFEKVDEFPYNGEFPRIKHLFELEEQFFSILNELGLGRIGFCHNDSNQKNLIWNPQTRKIGFIDFEMTMNNYVIMELGYLFGCFPGHFLYSFDADYFPNDDYRRKFLRNYLKEFNKLNDIKLSEEQFEEELEDMFIKVNLTTALFLIRLTMTGPLFDARTEMFKNEDLAKARKEIKWYCGKFSIKIWYLLNELKEKFLKSAKDHLEKKKNKNQKQETEN